MENRLIRALVGAAVLTALGAPAHAGPKEDALWARLRARLERLEQSVDGVVGLSVKDLKTGATIEVLPDEPFPQASVIKLAVLYELYRQADEGKVDLAEVTRPPASRVVGGGVLQYLGPSVSLTWRVVAVLMMGWSDNAATNVLIGKVGMSTVNSTMTSMKLPAIKVQRLMIRARESASGNENLATPAQAAELMRRIHTCELPMAKPRCDELRRILEIPKDGAFPASVPSSVRVVWKPGTVEGVETSWGLFALPGNPYVIAVMVNYSDGASGQAALRQIADAAYEYFRRITRTSAFGVRVPLQFADSVKKPPTERY